MIWHRIARWRRERILRRERPGAELWSRVLAETTAARHLDAPGRGHLRDLATLLLHAKSLEGAGGLELTELMRWRIAAEVCLPVLNLGLDLYRGWYSIIVYPAGFVARQEIIDEAGVLHDEERELIGEAWERGPVIFSWEDVADAAPGGSVVIHEMAHKLDMLDGAVNGRPPLHRDMDPAAWASELGAAFQHHRDRVRHGWPTRLDAYAAEDPGEFFSVASECFFCEPRSLETAYPQVYEQLAAYYRQRP